MMKKGEVEFNVASDAIDGWNAVGAQPTGMPTMKMTVSKEFDLELMRRGNRQTMLESGTIRVVDIIDTASRVRPR